jgi:hypothetical protein
VANIYVIDRRGRIVKRLTGAASNEALRALFRAIDAAIADHSTSVSGCYRPSGGPFLMSSQNSALRTKEALRLGRLDGEASQRWLCRGHFDLVGHDKALFADQGDSAVEQRCIGIVVANQFSSIHRTDDRGSIHLEIETIPL